MGTLNVKIPDEMEADIETYLERHPHYLNRSELVRDALRHKLVGSDAGGRRRPPDDDPLFTHPAVEVADPVDEADVDDVVYEAPEE